MVGCLGRGAPGVWGVPWGPPCSPLQDVGGRLLVVCRGCSVHRVPRQVFQHCPACVVLVCTQGAYRQLRGPSRMGERHRLQNGALRRWFEGQVGQWHRVWRQCAARGRRIEGSCRGHGPETPDGIALRVCLQPRLPVRGADSAVGLPLHRRSWKACSRWYTAVGTASRSSSSAGCAAAGHTPGVAARALSFSLTWSRRAWCSPSRSALTIMQVQSAGRITASGPGRRSGRRRRCARLPG